MRDSESESYLRIGPGVIVLRSTCGVRETLGERAFRVLAPSMIGLRYQTNYARYSLKTTSVHPAKRRYRALFLAGEGGSLWQGSGVASHLRYTIASISGVTAIPLAWSSPDDQSSFTWGDKLIYWDQLAFTSDAWGMG